MEPATKQPEAHLATAQERHENTLRAQLMPPGAIEEQHRRNLALSQRRLKDSFAKLNRSS